MADAWYYMKAGKRFGPVPSQQLKQLVVDGNLQPSDLIWKEGMKDWWPASKLPGMNSVRSNSAPPARHSQAPTRFSANTVASGEQSVIPSAKRPKSSPRRKLIALAVLLAVLLPLCVIGIGRALIGGQPKQTATEPESRPAKPEKPKIKLRSSSEEGTKKEEPSEDRSDIPEGDTDKSRPDIPKGLPPELSPDDVEDELPLEEIAKKIRKDSTPQFHRNPFYFSPQGRFLFIVYNDTVDHDRRVTLWNVKDSKEVLPRSVDCNYFSFPAAFSPDETEVACLDGDYLRIWNIGTSPADLKQSVLLPHPLDEEEKAVWNSVSWCAKDRILVELRYDSLSFQPLVRSGAAGFSTVGDVHSVPRHKLIETGAAASFDGSLLAVAHDLHPQAGGWGAGVQLTQCESDTDLTRLMISDGPFAKREFPSHTIGTLLDSNYADLQIGTCLDFSPGGRLATSQLRDGRPTVTFWDTDSSKEIATLSADSFDGQLVDDDDFAIRCYSASGTLLATTAVRTNRTNRGGIRQRLVAIWNLANGQRLQTFALTPEPTDPFAQEADRLRFTADETNLLITSVRSGTYNETRKRAEIPWKVESWSVKDGTKEYEVSGKLGISALSMCPDGRTLAVVASAKEGIARMEAWDASHLAALQGNVIAGDQYWAAKQLDEALKKYCIVLRDRYSWFFADDLSRLWSRCVDAYAATGDQAKGRQIVAYAQRNSIPLEPETDAGKRLAEKYLAELAAAKRKEMEKAAERERLRLSDVRANNQRHRILAAAVTRKDFIETLKRTMARGRIDAAVVNAIFEDYSFQDIFGEPDGDVEWIDSQRHLRFRCSDGTIQLTVILAESRTILLGIDKL